MATAGQWFDSGLCHRTSDRRAIDILRRMPTRSIQYLFLSNSYDFLVKQEVCQPLAVGFRGFRAWFLFVDVVELLDSSRLLPLQSTAEGACSQFQPCGHRRPEMWFLFLEDVIAFRHGSGLPFKVWRKYRFLEGSAPSSSVAMARS